MHPLHLSLPDCHSDKFDAYIVVSFVNATLVLSIGETVEEISDSGFLANVSTLGCGTMDEDSLIQVRLVAALCVATIDVCVCVDLC